MALKLLCAVVFLFAAGCSGHNGKIPAPPVNPAKPAMQKLTLNCKRGEFELTVMPTHPGIPPVDDCREIHVSIPDAGRFRAVLFLLPDKESDDPNAIMPVDQWTVPARWDDNTMLYVPSFDEKHILSAFAYVLDNQLEADAFEHENDAEF